MGLWTSRREANSASGLKLEGPEEAMRIVTARTTGGRPYRRAAPPPPGARASRGDCRARSHAGAAQNGHSGASSPHFHDQ